MTHLSIDALAVPMERFRIDPLDNQSGRIGLIGAENSFTGRQVDGDATLVAVEDLP